MSSRSRRSSNLARAKSRFDRRVSRSCRRSAIRRSISDKASANCRLCFSKACVALSSLLRLGFGLGFARAKLGSPAFPRCPFRPDLARRGRAAPAAARCCAGVPRGARMTLPGCASALGELRIRDYLSHAAGEQVRPRSPCLQRSLLAFSSDIGILKSGRGSKDFERTLGHPPTTQVEGCRSHAQKALSQSQSDA